MQMCPYKETTQQRGSCGRSGGGLRGEIVSGRPERASSIAPGSIPTLEILMIKVIGAAALGIALLSGISATADPEACQGATLVFRSARNSVGDYLRRYASCVSRSN